MYSERYNSYLWNVADYLKLLQICKVQVLYINNVLKGATLVMQVTLMIDFQSTDMQPECRIRTTECPKTLKRYIIVELEQ